MSESMASEKANHKRLLALSFLAIGVVFGDIGTSPLYAFREAFGQHGVEPLRENVLGVLSVAFRFQVRPASIRPE